VNRKWIGFSCGALLVAALWWFTPPAEPRLRLCGFHWLTGRDCPLCGLTRGLSALAHGHWREAVRYNLLTPLALGMLLALFWNHPVRARLWVLGIGAFAVYGVYRLV
jgi:hypothetical protein